MSNPTLRLPALLLLAVTAACASGGGSQAPAAGGGGSAQSRADAPSLERLEALYRARNDSARMNVHQADVHFITGMIVHHAQAVVMSAWAPEQAKTRAMQTLAARISNAQKGEIGLMQHWLQERDLPVPQVDDGGHVTGPGSDMFMDGMLTQEQLDHLEESRGITFDSLYLKYMIPHHQGAVSMVDELFAADGGAAQDEFVFKLANDIQVDQGSEIARMQGMLDAMRAGTVR
jgi:uncharacterized protein (DUF305 family)